MGKIGYANAADVAAVPGLKLGMYMLQDMDHTAIDAPQSASITSSGGHALITKTNHGKFTGDVVDIDAGIYASASPGGHFIVERIDANTFKLRTIPGNTLVNWISNSSVTYYPIATNSFYLRQTGDHDEKNFSLGDAFTGTYAADNHNADGTLKRVHGDHGDNYAGPIGDSIWWGFHDHSGATITNSGGKALITYAPGHGLKRGRRGKIKFSTHYNTQGDLDDNYYYFEPVLSGGVRSTTQFMIRKNATSDFVDYVANETVTWAIVPGASQMTGLDCKSSDPNNPIKVVTLASRPGQINMRKYPESTDNYCHEMWGGADYISIDGSYNPVEGTGSILYRGWADGFEFSRGRWGVYMEHKNYRTNNPCVYYTSGKGIKYKEIEIDNGDTGFSGFMAKNDSVATPIMDVTIENYFIHNIGDGEPLYIGETQQQVGGSAQVSHGIRLRLSNGVTLYSGSESAQLGQMVSGSYAENFVAFSASNSKYNPFTIGQVQGGQFRNQEGNVEIRNFVIMGWSFYGIYSQSDYGDKTPGGAITFRNFYLSHGSNGLGVFYDGHNDTTLKYIFQEGYMKNIDRVPEAKMFGGQPTDNNILFWTTSGNNAVINGITIDSAHASLDLYDGTLSLLNLPKVTRNQSVESIQFQNSGWAWHDPRKILLWEKLWDPADFHVVDLRGMQIPYQAGNVFRSRGRFYWLTQKIGDIGAITSSGGDALITCQEYNSSGALVSKPHGLETGDSFSITAGVYAGTSYTVEKISDTTFKFRSAGVLVAWSSNRAIAYNLVDVDAVEDHPDYFEPMTWDSTGRASTEPEHNPALTQYKFPPEDFRTKAGTLYARKGIGIFNTAPDPDRSRFEWEYAYNNAGSPNLSEIRKLPAPDVRDLSTADIKLKIGAGNHVRRKSTPVDIDGDVGGTLTDDFVQVN